MKRLLSLVLVAVLLLSGCSFGRKQMKEPVTYYYLRQHTQQEDYDLFFSDGAIGMEVREASGHRKDLSYLLALYMQGPQNSNLLSPFPYGSKITKTHLEDGKLTVTMNAISSRLDEMDVTISCACIAKTCMGLADVTEVTVKSLAADGQELFSRTFTSDTLILADTYTLPPEASEDTK